VSSKDPFGDRYGIQVGNDRRRTPILFANGSNNHDYLLARVNAITRKRVDNQSAFARSSFLLSNFIRGPRQYMTFGSQKMISRRALLLSQRGAVLVHEVKDLFDHYYRRASMEAQFWEPCGADPDRSLAFFSQ
jgi:hypothetical protein